LNIVYILLIYCREIASFLARARREADFRKEAAVSQHRHNEVFVKIHDQGWAVSKPKAERASGVFDTQAEAIERAQELAGKGTIHIQGRNGKFRKITTFEEE
jgi:hypothetical protein